MIGRLHRASTEPVTVLSCLRLSFIGQIGWCDIGGGEESQVVNACFFSTNYYVESYRMRGLAGNSRRAANFLKTHCQGCTRLLRRHQSFLTPFKIFLLNSHQVRKRVEEEGGHAINNWCTWTIFNSHFELI
ncbi:hypothetical protein C8Q75DRAFT_738818 [Abortiporus biennis]|nr:hypothetical protein C8Q75DRAFT_738818 [Abortiporus biennis]